MNEETSETEKNANIKNRKYLLGTCYSCQKCLYCSIDLTEDKEECDCDKAKKLTNSKYKKQQSGYIRNGVYDPNTSHPILITLLQTSNDLYGYNSDFSTRFNFTLCSKYNSQLTRNQSSYNKDLKKYKKTITQQLATPDAPASNSNTLFRFKLVIKIPDSTKPAKAITLKKNPDNYYKFNDLILQKFSKVVGLLVHNDYELSYKTEKGIEAITFLEEKEDFNEFIKEHNRLTSSDKVLLVFVTIQKHEVEKKKKVFMFKFIYLLLII